MKKQTREQVREHLYRTLSWQCAERDDEYVAKVIKESKEVDGVYTLEEAGLLDGFFEFMKSKGVLELIQGVESSEIQRVMTPLFQYVLLYLEKTIYGIEAINGMPELLFSNRAAMKLVGFNGHQIEQGSCRRGEAWLHEGNEKSKPISAESVAENVVKISLEEVEKLFNEGIRILAREGFYGQQLDSVVDATDLETTQNYEGCGEVTRKKKVVDKRGREQEIEIRIYGWKLLVLWCIKTRMPVAVKVVKINEHESEHLVDLVKQGQANVRGYAVIKRMVIDKGFLDGKDLWWIDQQHIVFIVPGKRNMEVVEDALSLIGEKDPDRIYPQSYERAETHGYGKSAKVETYKTEVVGVKGLLSYDEYGDFNHIKKKNRKDFEANPINAVVVKTWDNKSSEVVYLTNQDVSTPMKVFTGYDERSLVENTCFREIKQSLYLEHPPQKTQRGVIVHSYLVMWVLALTTAYRIETKQIESVHEYKSQKGVRKWRRELKEENRDKVIVFVGDKYGIYWVWELVMMLGLKVKEAPEGAKTEQEVLEKYGVNSDSS
ncbi:MAG: transposase [Nitrospira sp.]|nr:transposase [Nitrospira sp.]